MMKQMIILVGMILEMASLAFGQTQTLFATNFFELDAFAPGAVTPFSVKPFKFSYPSTLASDGNQIWTIWRDASGTDNLAHVNPVSAQLTVVGPLGTSWFSRSIACDPVTGKLFAIATSVGFTNHGVYSLDKVTGKATQVASLPFQLDGGVAISSTGAIYAAGGTWLYVLDSTTWQPTTVGIVSGLGFGAFLDFEFDDQGVLWSTYFEVNSSLTGIYIVDPVLLTATKWIPVPQPSPSYDAITFHEACVPVSYCTGKTNSLGCLPSIKANGQASATTALGFEIMATNVRNHRKGRLMWSTMGATSLPFHGGLLCVSPPLKFSGVVDSGGFPSTKDCSGKWSVDLNAIIFAQGGAIQPGMTINCQWWGRDAPGQSTLTDAIESVVCP